MFCLLRSFRNNPNRTIVTLDTTKTISFSKQIKDSDSVIYAFKTYNSGVSEHQENNNISTIDDNFSPSKHRKKCCDYSCQCKTFNPKTAPLSLSFVFSKNKFKYSKQINLLLCDILFLMSFSLTMVVVILKTAKKIKQISRIKNR